MEFGDLPNIRVFRVIRGESFVVKRLVVDSLRRLPTHGSPDSREILAPPIPVRHRNRKPGS
jgi:hypothetical protein